MKNFALRSALMLMMSISFLGCSGSDESECATISCKNGGSFVDCGCDCPDGYAGTDCSTQLTPSRIRISKITLRNFPITRSNGSNWDPGTTNAFPDVYIEIKNSAMNVIYQSLYYENASPVNNYDFTPTAPITITPTAGYVVEVKDYDDPSFEVMHASAVNFFTSGMAFSPILTLKSSDSKYIIDFHVTYEW